MSESIQSPLPTLTELSSALQTLQSALDPLLSRPLADTLAKLEASLPPPQTQTQDGSGPSGSNDSSSTRRLDSAKLRTSIAYVLLDLVWIHLRLKGVDPHTHPVAGELKRVQGYFVKIRNVEKAGPNSGSGAVEGGEAGKQRMRLDQGAAKRMVKGAIAEGGQKGRHTKFGGGEDEAAAHKGKGQQSKGQRRATKDPFDGYGDEEGQQQKGKAAAGKEDAGSSGKKTSAKKRHSDEAMGGEASGSATTSVDSTGGGGGGGASKHQKKKQKKQRHG